MTNPKPDPSGGEPGLGWVQLADRVAMNRAWLTSQAPRLFSAWQQARTSERRQELALQIQRLAFPIATASDAQESDIQATGPDAGEDPGRYYVPVRVQWTQNTRYEIDLHISPHSTDEELWTEIQRISPDARHRHYVTDEDSRLVDIRDDGGSLLWQGQPNRDAARDWGDVADAIDERLAESPDWPALSAALDRAATGGYDVEVNLPRLAAQEPLPVRHPARELHYRLMQDCAAALPTALDLTDQVSDRSDDDGVRTGPGAPPLPLTVGRSASDPPSR